MTNLQKASKEYLTAEEMRDVEDSCWNLLILLQNLGILKKSTGEYHHVVASWYFMYMERRHD